MTETALPPRRPLWARNVFLLGLLALAAYNVYDFTVFIGAVEKYSRFAAKGPTLPKQGVKTEAIVVLTGDKHRIPKGLELLRQRGSPLLVISGVRKGISLKEIVNLQGDSVVNIHEIWGKIELESKSLSTIENARETGKILGERNLRRVILVTSEYHMRRALQIFKQVNPKLEIVPYPILSDVSELLHFDLSPRSFTAAWFLWNEYWKSVIYRTITKRHATPVT